jgi:hypothetical protein
MSSNATNHPIRWKQIQKVEATKNGRGNVECSSSAALRIESPEESTTVFGSIAVEESVATGSVKLFRLAYDGSTMDGEPVCGTVEFPKDHWELDTVKARSENARARLLLLRFVHGDIKEVQLTLPIFNHQDSKKTKAVVDSILIYGTHFINNKSIRIGKETLGR